MRNRLIFSVAVFGLIAAVVTAFLLNRQPIAQPPAFTPAANPYANGIYANGIVESDQTQGVNINIYPEVTGPIAEVLVSEGQAVKKGQALIAIDDSVQRPTTEQQQAAYDVTVAQIANAKAVLKSASDTLAKQERSYALDPRSVSRDVLDTNRNTVKVDETNLAVIERQSIQQGKAFAASAALLAKYTIRAPMDGVVMSVQAAAGSYVSSQGAYNPYTQAYDPLIVMGSPQSHLNVRAYIDEILVNRLADPANLNAEMFIRGTDVHVPLSFVRIQPYVSPKIQLSDQKQERVDVRTLPIIFRFDVPKNVNLYPGQLVDVYVRGK